MALGRNKPLTHGLIYQSLVYQSVRPDPSTINGARQKGVIELERGTPMGMIGVIRSKLDPDHLSPRLKALEPVKRQERSIDVIACSLLLAHDCLTRPEPLGIGPHAARRPEESYNIPQELSTNRSYRRRCKFPWPRGEKGYPED